MKKLLLTTAVLAMAVSVASAQTMPPASITANSTSPADLAALQSIIDTNAAKRAAIAKRIADDDAKAKDAKDYLDDFRRSVWPHYHLRLQRRVNVGC
jgi:hypothetical protein